MKTNSTFKRFRFRERSWEIRRIETYPLSVLARSANMFLLILSLLFLFSFPSLADPARGVALAQDNAYSERRVALVIGNWTYKASPLKNPKNDAADMARALGELGFQVIYKSNASRKEMGKAVQQFGRRIREGGVGLFYYAGHGMQVKGKNHLIPVGAAISSEDDVPFESVDANRVLAKMESARNRLNLVILDACRDNPFARSFRSSGSGLARMDAPSGTLIVYATGPGRVASDGDGRNSPFTKHLLTQMKVPGQKAEEVFKKVRVGVRRDTDNRQTPWEASSLTGDFYFVDAKGSGAGGIGKPDKKPGGLVTSGVDPDIELAAWNTVQQSKDPDMYRIYLEDYPNGRFVRFAERMLKKLGASSREKTPDKPRPAINRSIVIGASVAQTGKYARTGQEQLNGIQLWVENINARGGLLGRPVRFMYYDDESRLPIGAKHYEKLITDDRVDLLIGPYSSGITLAASTVAERYGIPMVSAGASASRIWSRGYKNIFGLYTPAEKYMDQVLEFAKSKGLTKVALIYSDTTFPRAVANGVRKKVKKLNMNLVFKEEYGKGSTDFSDMILKIRRKRPDIVIGGSYLPDSMAFTRQAKKNRLKAKIFAFAVGPGLPNFGKQLGADAEGVMGNSQWDPNLDLAGVKEFVRAYKEKHDHLPGYHAAGGYGAGQVVEAAVNRSGSVKPDKVRRALF
uniref:ABC-type branched-chain amino acid transport system, substrate-binding protein n=1 Tax=Candidatus Kentrum sp. TUN TaxID=2126343 RepID=A0A451A3S4_9GAMM|nr:MAG: ABC-type branched-chain amino acid transport system, substrate-binding protein [Candidatus Kentron sp. TUN]